MSNGLFDMKSGITFQPDVQARFEAWRNDPKNQAAIGAALHAERGGHLLTGRPDLQAALAAGVIKPEDFDNAASNDSNYSIDATGRIGPHEGLFKGMGPALVAGAGVTGLGLLAGTGAGTTGGGAAASAWGGGAAGDVGPVAGGAATTTAAQTGAGSVLAKYGAPVLGGAINGYLANKNAARTSRQALEVQQSEQDPFRGVMHQTEDLGRLQHAMTPPTPYGPRAGSPYAAAAGPAQGPLQLSDGYLQSLQRASALVGQGQGQVPDQTDPSNWGNYGTSALADPGASFTPPQRPVSSLLARRLRPRGAAGPSPTPWTFAAA